MAPNSKPGGAGFYPVLGTGLSYGSEAVIPVPYGAETEREARLWDIWRDDLGRYLWLSGLPEGGETIRDITKAWEVNNNGR